MGSADVRTPSRDEQRVADGLDVQQPSGEQLVALIRVLAEKLEAGRRIGSVNPLMEFLYSNISKASERLKAIPTACGRGCSHCCYSPWVDANPAEVLFAVKSMDPERRRLSMESVQTVSEQTRGKSPDERAAIVAPCPLLEDEACSIYAGRPVVCRSMVSEDSGLCGRSYRELTRELIPSPMVWQTLGGAYSGALECAMLHAGLSAASHEWNESLWLALGDPGAEGRWLAGEDVFRDVPRRDESGAMDNASWAYLYRQAFGSAPPRSR